MGGKRTLGREAETSTGDHPAPSPRYTAKHISSNEAAAKTCPRHRGRSSTLANINVAPARSATSHAARASKDKATTMTTSFAP